MNIWFINNHGTGPDEPATRSYDLGRNLVSFGHSVTVFASGFSHYKRQERKVPAGESHRIEDLDGVKFCWIKTYPYQRNDLKRVVNMVSFAWRANRLGRSFAAKPDAIIGINPPPLAALSACRLAKSLKVPFVFEVKDLWPQTLVSMGALSEGSPITRMMRKLEKHLYQSAQKIVVLLPFADEYIASMGVSPSKVVWIPNGIDMRRYSKVPPYDGEVKEAFTVMYLGGHTASNALDVLLKAAGELRDRGQNKIRFVLVGDGTEKDNLKETVRQVGLQNVEFRNPVPKDQVQHLMGEADAFISCLRDVPGLHKYGISLNKMLDYLASQRPIVFSANSRNNPVAEAGAGISVSAEDPEAIAGALEGLMALSPEQRRDMGQKGLKYIQEKFEIGALAAKYHNLLTTIQ